MKIKMPIPENVKKLSYVILGIGLFSFIYSIVSTVTIFKNGFIDEILDTIINNSNYTGVFEDLEALRSLITTITVVVLVIVVLCNLIYYIGYAFLTALNKKSSGKGWFIFYLVMSCIGLFGSLTSLIPSYAINTDFIPVNSALEGIFLLSGIVLNILILLNSISFISKYNKYKSEKLMAEYQNSPVYVNTMSAAQVPGSDTRN